MPWFFSISALFLHGTTAQENGGVEYEEKKELYIISIFSTTFCLFSILMPKICQVWLKTKIKSTA